MRAASVLSGLTDAFGKTLEMFGCGKPYSMSNEFGDAARRFILGMILFFAFFALLLWLLIDVMDSVLTVLKARHWW